MAALSKFWRRHGYPPEPEINNLRIFIERRAASGTLQDWRDVLDAALSDAGYAVSWRGSQVLEVTEWH